MSRVTTWVCALSALLLAACSDGTEQRAGETSAATQLATTASATTAPPATSSAAAATILATVTSSAESPTSADPGLADDLVPVEDLEVVVFPVPAGSRPHDVAPAADGGVWYTAQRLGALGHLDVESGATRQIPLGAGSAPHGVITGPDGVVWITDGGLNAIVRVDPATDEVRTYPLPASAANANLNTATLDGQGRVWFTGQAGYYGVLDPATGTMDVRSAPRGRGPYGITATPDGAVFFASLAGSYVGAIGADGSVTEIYPPTPRQGARRVWSDSAGAIWVSEWNSGQLSRFEPGTGTWSVWPLPGKDPSAYAVFVDEDDRVWVTDFGGNAVHRFDPATETFATIALPASPGEVRQLHGRGDEVWGAQSADDSLIVIRPRRGPA